MSSEPCEDEAYGLPKLTRDNWIQWKAGVTIILRSMGLGKLFDEKWLSEVPPEKQAKLNSKALLVLLQTVGSELRPKVTFNNESFKDAWDALESECRRNTVASMCDALHQLLGCSYPPGSSLLDHINTFKDLRNDLRTITRDSDIDAGELTEFQTAAIFLKSLESDPDLLEVVQVCYDVKPFTLENVSKQVIVEAFLTAKNAAKDSRFESVADQASSRSLSPIIYPPPSSYDEAEDGDYDPDAPATPECFSDDLSFESGASNESYESELSSISSFDSTKPKKPAA